MADTVTQADAADAPSRSKSMTTRRIVLAELRKHIPGVLALALLTLLVTLVNVFSPLLYRALIDDAIPARNFGKIAWISVGIVLAPISIMGLLAGQNYFRSHIGVSVTDALRQSLFKHVLRGQVIALERVKTSEIVYRLTRACGQIGQVYISDKLLPLVSNTILLLGYVLVMFAVNWKLAVIACLAVPLSYGLAQRLTHYAYTVDAQYSHTLEAGQSYLQEVFVGLRTVRSFRGERLENDRWEKWLRGHSGNYMKMYVAHYAYLFLSEFVNSLLVGIVFVIGAAEIVRGEISIGSLLSFVFYVPSAYAALRVIFQGQLGIAEARVAAEKIDSLLAIEAESPGSEPLTLKPGVSLAVEFRDVSFTYGRGDFSVEHLTFRVQPGQLVGIVGVTGGGKSTILDLLMGFYQPQSGTILIDGLNLQELSLDSVREHVSLVPQDIFLWNASIRENILYPQKIVQAPEMLAAAELAQINQLIDGLPQKYDTVVGERGQNLSGGERQRLAICRSLLQQPQLLLLDEATSALDAITELKLRDAIGRIKHGRTTIVVAHRLATIMQADNVIVLDQGRLVEMGTPADLIGSGGLFSRLYQAQQL